MVEMALIAPLLIFLMFGIVEFGWLLHDYHMISAACRVGARVAAVGATPTEITQRVMSIHTGLSSGEISLAYKAITDTTWTVLGTNTIGNANDAPKLAQLRVTVTHPHTLLMGTFFGFLASSGETSVKDITHVLITTRE